MAVSWSHVNVFPPEIWFQLLDSSLSFNDLQNLSLASGFLQEVTRPLIFRSLTFRPPSPSPSTLSSPVNTTFSERLDFLSSDAVAPWVREVKIIWERPEPSNSVDNQQAYEILGAKLSQFERLSKIHAEWFTFNTIHLQALAMCPYLKRVNLVNCPIEPTHPLPTAQCGVVELAFRDGASVDGTWWSPFISPITTRTITATTFQSSMQLMDILASKLVMTQLRHLTLCSASPSSPRFFKALSRCPALETLRFVGEDLYIPVVSTVDRLPSSIIPHLTTIRAGVECFPSYIAGRPLKEIEVTGDLDGDQSASRFISKLHEYYPKLTSIKLNTTGVSNRVLVLPLTKFTCLEECYLENRKMTDERLVEICEWLQEADLPSRLRLLTIGSCETSRNKVTLENSNLALRLKEHYSCLEEVGMASASMAFHYRRD